MYCLQFYVYCLLFTANYCRWLSQPTSNPCRSQRLMSLALAKYRASSKESHQISPLHHWHLIVT